MDRYAELGKAPKNWNSEFVVWDFFCEHQTFRKILRGKQISLKFSHGGLQVVRVTSVHAHGHMNRQQEIFLGLCECVYVVM
jgi:hypothetical protein